MKNLNEEVGNRIYTVRIEKGITLKELGDLVGLSESTVQRYEKGKIKNVDIKNIKNFAEALDISPAYLMGWNTSIDDKELSLEDSQLKESLNRMKGTISKFISDDMPEDIKKAIEAEKFVKLTLSQLNTLNSTLLGDNEDSIRSFMIFVYKTFPNDISETIDVHDFKKIYEDVRNFTEYNLMKIKLKSKSKIKELPQKEETPDHIKLNVTHEIE